MRQARGPTNEAELAKVETILAQGETNGVEGVEMIGGNAARAMEAELFCIGALLSPETGIIDSHAYMRSFWGELEDCGGMIAFEIPVERMSFQSGQWQVQFGGRDPGVVQFDAVVNAAGLGAQDLARHIEGYPADKVPRLVLGKGNYFGFAGRPAFSRLIYPTPIDGGLGVHVTLDIAGRMRSAPTSSGSRKKTTPSIRGARKASTPASAPIGRACRTVRWCRIRRHPAQALRAGRRPGRFSDRRPRRPRPAAAGHSVRHRIAGADVVAVAGRSGGERFGLTIQFDGAIVHPV